MILSTRYYGQDLGTVSTGNYLLVVTVPVAAIPILLVLLLLLAITTITYYKYLLCSYVGVVVIEVAQLPSNG